MHDSIPGKKDKKKKSESTKQKLMQERKPEKEE